ncbi:hypothetical protein KP509_29G045200 [Ceratopteris richardii]|uniref:Reverse transcriptase Ty1/copia-type domain-containing protein n=1 Tax=Ceratopteris richardii TaxID=49495 RepID=A0A8T2R6M4_CERRI|nr:hypothetical protein KP509_29G045200 [Ceratopteris richardii]KAH7291986.1 hypothetical protein KP509_29G045200 [Ceratopteris richardii]
MTSCVYSRFQSEPNVYSRHSPDAFLLAIYVDDILLLSNSIKALNSTKHELQDAFSMSDLGPLQYCLGMQVLRDPQTGSITLSQSTDINSLLQKFHMDTYKGTATPLPSSLKSGSTALPSEVAPDFPFAQILGSIHYLVTCTRPDICFAANYLSRFMQQPQAHHIHLLKRLLRYLKQTQHYSLTYRTQPEATRWTLYGYSDADWGGDHVTMQSTSGYLYMLSGAALSSTEAEYVSMTLALKEGLWLQTLLEKTKLMPRQSLLLHCDNVSAIILAKNLKHSEKTKHIALKLQFIREMVQEGKAELVHVRTQYQWADFLTKSLPKAKHRMLLK